MSRVIRNRRDKRKKKGRYKKMGGCASVQNTFPRNSHNHPNDTFHPIHYEKAEDIVQQNTNPHRTSKQTKARDATSANPEENLEEFATHIFTVRSNSSTETVEAQTSQLLEKSDENVVITVVSESTSLGSKGNKSEQNNSKCSEGRYCNNGEHQKSVNRMIPKSILEESDKENNPKSSNIIHHRNDKEQGEKCKGTKSLKERAQSLNLSIPKSSPIVNISQQIAKQIKKLTSSHGKVQGNDDDDESREHQRVVKEQCTYDVFCAPQDADFSNTNRIDEYSYTFQPLELKIFMHIMNDSRLLIPSEIPRIPPKNCSSKKITLALDLDNTLICTKKLGRDEVCEDCDFIIETKFQRKKYAVYKRPYLEQFLDFVSSKFEIVLFTAAGSHYAEPILERIDPKGKHFEHKIYVEGCIQVVSKKPHLCGPRYTKKDLSILGRNLSSCCLLDDKLSNMLLKHIHNGIPIKRWFFYDRHDEELRKIIPFLNTVAGAKDVRKVIFEKFDLPNQILEGKKRFSIDESHSAFKFEGFRKSVCFEKKHLIARAPLSQLSD